MARAHRPDEHGGGRARAFHGRRGFGEIRDLRRAEARHRTDVAEKSIVKKSATKARRKASGKWSVVSGRNIQLHSTDHRPLTTDHSFDSAFLPAFVARILFA